MEIRASEITQRLDGARADATGACEVARGAARARHSLAGVGRYATRFQPYRVRLSRLERELGSPGALASVSQADRDVLLESLRALHDPNTKLSSRLGALQRFNFVLESAVVPALSDVDGAEPATQEVIPLSVVSVRGYLKVVATQ